jgi:N-acetyl-anhydromuramyl-L-alanine amidase AmpD
MTDWQNKVFGKQPPRRPLQPQKTSPRRGFPYRYLLIPAIIFILYLFGDYFWRERRWRFIVVHHTAGTTGNLDYIRELHMRKNGWPDIAYHFLINNGSMNTSIGQIQVSGLWEKRSLNYSTKISYVNYLGIAVALVGNFEEHKVHPLQHEALINLLTNLSIQYNVPPEKIIGHNELQNTQCPGKHLNMNEVRRDVARAVERKRGE